MRRTLVLLLVVVVAIFFAACGDNNNKTSNNLTGNWTGTFTSSNAANPPYTATFLLTDNNGNLTGSSIQFSNAPACFGTTPSTGATMAGNWNPNGSGTGSSAGGSGSGQPVQLLMTTGPDTTTNATGVQITINGTLSTSTNGAKTITGTYSTSVSTACVSADSGTVTLTQGGTSL